MDYDRDKVDEIVLALLWLTNTGEHRAWKTHDWDAMDRLHAKGYIADPKSKAKSVVLSEEGERLSRELFERHFGGGFPCQNALAERTSHYSVAPGQPGLSRDA
ncbi:MAG TPA: DUF6429 family protein [Terriglobales bacterium]|nr:DUF6429 family protein [Terriglobales bacterium]